MKTTLSVLLLSLVLILSSCGGGGQPACRLNGPPNGHYIVFYPNGHAVQGTIDALGVFFVPAVGYSCAQLVVRTGSNFGLTLAASPSSVYLPSPPATGTITGQSFDATYGMPMVEYFDGNGYLVGSVYATSVSGNGTSLQANTPDLSYAYSGTYQIKVTNKTYDGYYLNIVGSATVSAWGRDRTDSDGDGWYDDEDCAPYDPYLNASCVETCGGDDRTPYTICNPY
jgi:hypothetical protein